MKTVSLRLQDRLAGRLSTLARKRKTSKSAIVREALEAYFANGTDPQQLTLRDLMQDLIVDDPQGPTDLSTNPKYMRLAEDRLPPGRGTREYPGVDEALP